jgi:translation initiation factor IF-1
MVKDDRFEINGIIKDINRNIFIVEIIQENGNSMEIPCTLSGKLRMNKIKLLRGDSVTIDISIADISKGRIIWRNK